MYELNSNMYYIAFSPGGLRILALPIPLSWFYQAIDNVFEKNRFFSHSLHIELDMPVILRSKCLLLIIQTGNQDFLNRKKLVLF